MIVITAKCWTTKIQKEKGQHLFARCCSSVIFFVLPLLLFQMANGCTDFRLRAGVRPDTSVLETELHVGKSMARDVLEVLGTPHGKGKSYLPIDTNKRELWSYYYEEGSLKDSRRIFLFVFFDRNRYEGYMWFSSLP